MDEISKDAATQKYLVLFHTHSGALGYEQELKKQQIPCQLMPSPRSLSSSCGICLIFQFPGLDEILRQGLPLQDPWVNHHVDRLYVWKNKDQYDMVYEDEQ